ncbi:MAG: oxygenase MpaB family protein [Gaiellales bacterium]
MASRDGYFTPESVIRRIGNSPLTPFLGGGPAVLLQVAHPLVAAGVVEHSDYRGDLWRRLRRTLEALYLITYGSRAEADRAGEIVRTVHEHVHGTTTARLGPYPAGTPYRASDPELQLWVHATLVECSLSVYERFVAPLTCDERERYYREMRIVGRLFGVPGGTLPRSLAEFREYFGAMIRGPEITVTEPARAVARVIVAADLPQPVRLLVPAHRLACARLLPARLRREYGLRWPPLHARALPVAALGLRVGTAPVLRAAARLRQLQPAAAGQPPV